MAFLFLLAAWVFEGFVMFGAPVLERGIMLDSSLACMVASRLWRFVTSRLGSSRPAPTWRLASDRHDPSTFSRVEVHYLKFTSAILSRDMTSSVTVETVGDDLWRVVTTRRVVTIRREASPFLRPATDRVYIGHEWEEEPGPGWSICDQHEMNK